MDGIKKLKSILTSSLKKNGDQVLTVSHLNNMLADIISKDSARRKKIIEDMENNENDNGQFRG